MLLFYGHVYEVSKLTEQRDMQKKYGEVNDETFIRHSAMVEVCKFD